MRRAGLAAALVIGTLIVAAAGNLSLPSGGSATTNYTVPRLLEEKPLKSTVRVTGNVSRLLTDYTSESGNVYQQFYIRDGDAAVKVFCSTAAGRINVSVGDRVTVKGTFQEFYGEVEIYTRCAGIRTE